MVSPVADPGSVLGPSPTSVEDGSRHRFPVVWFVLKRLGAGLLTLLIVSVLIFLCTSVIPGDAVTVILGKNGTPETVAALQAQLGLDQPLYAQYLHWLFGILHGDLGTSAVALAQKQPDPTIAHTLKDPLINSLILGTLTALLLIPLTLVLGAIAGI